MILAAGPLPDSSHVPMLLTIGFAIVAGSFGARIFQKLRIPQVVGYIAIGVLVGQSWLNWIDEQATVSLHPFTNFALGVIGFMIGGELHRDVFKKYGRQFITILLSEGLAAFVVVGLLVGGLTMLVTGGNLRASVAMGLLFGAISSATAPAATVSVLWEYKTRGVLTSAIFAIVAMDDALALGLFSIAATVSTALVQTTGAAEGTLSLAGRALYELSGAIAMGVAAGFGLNFILRRVRDPANALAFIIGAVALVIGLATMAKVDLILSAMALGVTLANLAPRRSREAFDLVERFAAPIYVLFFVIAGAGLNIYAMKPWMWLLAVPYVVGRMAAKVAGANLGARWVKAAPVLRKYLGMGLFCQGGVALGLAILARSRFTGPIGGPIGDAIMMIVTATTFVTEFVGPPFVKLAVKKAGEVGLNVTEADLMQAYKVRDMVDRASPTFAESTPLTNILRTIAATDAMHYPVVDGQGKLSGIIGIQELKQAFGGEGLSDWLVAFDLMEPPPDTVGEDAPLAEAVARMHEEKLEYLPVIVARDHMRLAGLLELRTVDRRLSQEVLRRRRLAET